MIVKRGLLFAGIIFFLLFGSDFAAAVDLEDVGNTPELIEQKRWEFLSAEWKELLMKNKLIGPVDSFFRAIPELIYKIIFGTPYDLSLTFFFVAVLWVITALSAERYTVLLGKDWRKSAYAVLITIALAQTQAFTYIAKGAVTLISKPVSLLWSILIFVLFLVVIFVYYQVNRMLGSYFAAAKAAKEKQALEARMNMSETFIKGVKEGMSS